MVMVFIQVVIFLNCSYLEYFGLLHKCSRVISLILNFNFSDGDIHKYPI